MMKLLVFVSLSLTLAIAYVAHPHTCEDRGGKVVELLSVDGGPDTKICVRPQ